MHPPPPPPQFEQDKPPTLPLTNLRFPSPRLPPTNELERQKKVPQKTWRWATLRPPNRNCELSANDQLLFVNRQPPLTTGGVFVFGQRPPPPPPPVKNGPATVTPPRPLDNPVAPPSPGTLSDGYVTLDLSSLGCGTHYLCLRGPRPFTDFASGPAIPFLVTAAPAPTFVSHEVPAGSRQTLTVYAPSPATFDTRSGGDALKAVPAPGTCAAAGESAALWPPDDEAAPAVEALLTLPSAGAHRLCYRAAGGEWVALEPTLQVTPGVTNFTGQDRVELEAGRPQVLPYVRHAVPCESEEQPPPPSPRRPSSLSPPVARTLQRSSMAAFELATDASDGRAIRCDIPLHLEA